MLPWLATALAVGVAAAILQTYGLLQLQTILSIMPYIYSKASLQLVAVWGPAI